MAIFSSSSSSKGCSKGVVLPTYEQSQSTSPDASIDLPHEKAAAGQVRYFLVQLLITKRGLSEDQARRIAKKWTKGSARELRVYPASMYADIFGRDDGCIVYKEVKTLYYQRDIDAKKAKGISNFHAVSILIALICEGLLIWGIVYGFMHNSPILVVFLGLGCSLVTTGLSFVLLREFFAPPISAASRVESNMKRFWAPPILVQN